MTGENSESNVSQRWEGLYKDALFEGDVDLLPRRIELAKNAVLDRLEDLTCSRSTETIPSGEMAALRNARRALCVLEKLYVPDSAGKLVA